MSYSIPLAEIQLWGLTTSVCLIFFLVFFFNFRGKCPKCGCRFAYKLKKMELYDKIPTLLIFRLTYRKCLWCRYEILIRKSSETRDISKGVTIIKL